MKKIISTALFLAALLGCATPDSVPPDAGPSAMEPWTPTRAGFHPADLGDLLPPPVEESGHAPMASSPTTATIYLAWRLYSQTLSRSMGETCRFSPTCSRFALEAMSQGPEGVVLTFGRLMRNHLDQDFYPLTEDGYLADPPSHYYFWRSESGVHAHQSGLERSHAWFVLIRAAENLPENFFDE